MEPTLIINPVDDDAFAALVRECAREAGSAGELQLKLRERYPSTVVRQRELSGETATIWYVYRDGRWTAGGADRAQPTAGREDDLRATAESIVEDADRLKELELRKLHLKRGTDQEASGLASEAADLADEISTKAQAEDELADELAGDRSGQPGGD